MKLKLYLSSEINGDDIGTQLFQIANVVKYEKESKKNNIKRKNNNDTPPIIPISKKNCNIIL